MACQLEAKLGLCIENIGFLAMRKFGEVWRVILIKSQIEERLGLEHRNYSVQDSDN